MNLQSSETWRNLNDAMNAEARVHFLYCVYADKARKEGRHEAARLFDEVARNERAHAKVWYNQLHPDTPDSLANLTSAAEGEHFEWTRMYAQYAQIARQEGFDEIARLFELTAGVERVHEGDYGRRQEAMRTGSAFHSEAPVEWICTNCGYRVTAADAPDTCPLCAHPQSWYRRVGTNP